MNFPINLFQIEEIQHLLLKIFEGQKDSKIFIITLWLQGWLEKTGRIICLDGGMLCIQIYEQWENNSFEGIDSILYILIKEIITFQIHGIITSEAWEILKKEQKPINSLPKLEIRRKFLNAITEISGSENLEINILWDTFDITNQEIVLRFTDFLKVIEKSIWFACSDLLGKEAWKNQIQSIEIQGANTQDVVRKDKTLVFSFSTALIKNPTSSSDVASMIENLL